MEIDKIIRASFHGFSDEQWQEVKNTFPFSEIPFIVKRALEAKQQEKPVNMELIKELQKQEKAFSTEDYRMLKAVKAGDYFLSIQGSNTHYCTPRESLPVDIYSSMELAIINKKGSMVSINRSKLIRKFSRYSELVERADSLNSKATVYGYVSVDLLNDLYCFLNGR